MSIIAVSHLPNKWTMAKIVTSLGWAIKGEFEAINCVPTQGMKGKKKTCYVRLSERLDPQQVVEKLTESGRFKAFIPSHVPDLQPSKHGKMQPKQRRILRIPETNPGQVFVVTHLELMTELQAKYSGLYNLSLITHHDLLESIAGLICDRLKKATESHPEAMESGFRLSSLYRRFHPHSGDFQMIMSSLHRLQDNVNVPRSQLLEAELMANDIKHMAIDNIPYKVVTQVSRQYSEKIIKKLTEHINTLNSESTQLDSTEEKAQKKVRAELKKISPYLNLIVHRVIGEHFAPSKSPFLRFRIYGEPYLPKKIAMIPFLKKFGAVKIDRSDRIYNMIRCNVPGRMATALHEKDGTMMGDAKLIIRSSDIPLYKISPSIMTEIKSKFGCNVGIDNIDDLIEEEQEEEDGDEDME